MAEIETVKKIARHLLCQGAGTWLWERACRREQNVRFILGLKELVTAEVPFDKFCLIAAAYFFESGLAYKREKDKAKSIEIDPKELHELSKVAVSEKLGPVLTSLRLAGINNIISEVSSRFTKLPEAMVLSDAIGLEDMGVLGVLNDFRKFTAEGKGAAEFLSNFKCKIDYRYWDARLKEGFRFESVQKIARQRYNQVESFMNQLAEEIASDDFEEIVID